MAGNHEFYGHHWDAHLALLRAQAGLHGIDFLENDTVTIDGIRFLGATLWTDFAYFGASRRSQNIRLAEHALNDFRLIMPIHSCRGRARPNSVTRRWIHWIH